MTPTQPAREAAEEIVARQVQMPINAPFVEVVAAIIQRAIDRETVERDQRIAGLEGVLRQARADSERLDWIEKSHHGLVCLHNDLRGPTWTADFEAQEWTECESARAAIDEARGRSKQ